MFIVIEIQTSNAVSTLTWQYDTLQAAEAKYHSILASAAVSSLPVHAAVVMTNAGTVVKSEYYRHGGEAE